MSTSGVQESRSKESKQGTCYKYDPSISRSPPFPFLSLLPQFPSHPARAAPDSNQTRQPPPEPTSGAGISARFPAGAWHAAAVRDRAAVHPPGLQIYIII